MLSSNALVATWVSKSDNKLLANLLAIFTGVLLLSVFAQIIIPLPYTPVPITGQTFAVAVISLLWGSHRAVATVATYLLIGAAGLPVFASLKSGLAWGPTSGYLVGMLVASFVMGKCAERNWNSNFIKSYFCILLGSVITFSFGLLVLSYFVPSESVLALGLIPFIPGDFIKSIVAAKIVSLMVKNQA